MKWLDSVSEEETEQVYGNVNYGDTQRTPPSRTERTNYRCNIHKTNDHFTEECNGYVSKTPQEKFEIIKACWSCLKLGHRLSDCWNKNECGTNGCTQFHHVSLHDVLISGRNYPINHLQLNSNCTSFLPASARTSEGSQIVTHTSTSFENNYKESTAKCLLPIMEVQSKYQKL